MNNYFFDPSFYLRVYYTLLFLFVLFTIMYFLNRDFNQKNREDFIKFFGYTFLLVITFLIAFKPIYHLPGDIYGYIHRFNDFKTQYYFDWEQSEMFFAYFTFLTSKVMLPEFYFAIIGVVYVFGVFYACKNWLQNDWFYGFIMLICAFEFLNYGINGIRNGVATSIFLLGISKKNIYLKLLIIYLSINVHKSILLPAVAYLLTFINNNSIFYIAFWFLTIPLSFLYGELFEAQLEIYYPDEKLQEYFQGYYDEIFSETGFRWDFVAYSFLGVFLGWFYIYYLNFKDIIYQKIYNAYLFANSAWILIIGVNYTNRFAYLSWFFLGIVISYPLVKQQNLIKNQNFLYLTVLIVFAGFTLIKNRSVF